MILVSISPRTKCPISFSIASCSFWTKSIKILVLVLVLRLNLIEILVSISSQSIYKNVSS